MTRYFFKSLNPYKNKWERHNVTFNLLDECMDKAVKLNECSGRAVQVFSATNRKSTLILDLPENTN